MQAGKTLSQSKLQENNHGPHIKDSYVITNQTAGQPEEQRFFRAPHRGQQKFLLPVFLSPHWIRLLAKDTESFDSSLSLPPSSSLSPASSITTAGVIYGSESISIRRLRAELGHLIAKFIGFVLFLFSYCTA